MIPQPHKSRWGQCWLCSENVRACSVTSVVSDSLQPHGLLCPWDSPDKNTGVGCHFLLQNTKAPFALLIISLAYLTNWRTLIYFHEPLKFFYKLKIVHFQNCMWTSLVNVSGSWEGLSFGKFMLEHEPLWTLRSPPGTWFFLLSIDLMNDMTPLP